MAPPALLLDAMLGKLAVYLRACGIDTVYALDWGIEDDAVLRYLALWDARTLLTRDAELAERVPDSLYLEAHELSDQLRLVQASGIQLEIADPPTRCGRCNGLLAREPPGCDRPSYAPEAPTTRCWWCPRCGQYFWKGSHFDDLRSRIPEMLRTVD